MPEADNPCVPWDEDLSALLDGELAPEREAEVRAHVEGCARCTAQLASLRRVDEILAAAPLPEVSERVRRATLGRAAPPHRRRRWLAAPALAAAAAVALYLAVRPAAHVEPAGKEVPSLADTAPEAEAPARPGSAPSEDAPPVQIVQPLPPPALPPPPDVEIPAFTPEFTLPERVAEAEPELEDEPPEDLAVVLFGAEEPDDFDVIANLEVLERLVALEAGRG